MAKRATLSIFLDRSRNISAVCLHSHTPEEELSRIDVSSARADRMVTLWEKRWKRPPTQEEFNGLVDQYINDEVLYREALAMGFDRDDTVVRCRMAQKVKFISNGLITIDTPSEKELQSYLDTHTSKYQLAGKITFRHIYFNLAKHDASMETEAEQLLAKLLEFNIGMSVDSVGDGFLHGTEFINIKEFELNRLLGKEFTQALFEKPVGKWVGPLASSYGLHLIFIESKSRAKTAALEEAKESVLEDWMTEERKKANEAFVKSLREQYAVVISKPTSVLLPEKNNE